MGKSPVLTFACTLLLAMTVNLSDEVLAQSGQMDRELEQLYAGTNINPFDAAASNNMALKFFRQGQYERALKLLQRAQRLAPERQNIKKNAEYLQLLMSQVENLDDETASSLSRSFEKEEIPFVPEPWGQWGNRISAAAGAETVEIPDYSEPVGVNANPFDTDSLIIIADIKIKRGDLRGALSDLKRAERISPWVSGLSNRISQLESQVPADDHSDLEYSAVVAPDVDFVDVPPPAAWPVDKKARRYLE